MNASPAIPNNTSSLFSHRSVARLTAVAIVLYGVFQVATIVTRLMSGSDQPDALDAAAMIAANHGWYLASKISNLAAALFLLVAAVGICRVFRELDPFLSLAAATFLGVAAIFWMFSSMMGLAVAEVVGAATAAAGVLTGQSPEVVTFHALEPVRAMAGRVGFTAAALGLLPLSAIIGRWNMLPRWVRWFGWTGWVVAAAMFFIWDPGATAMHRLGGTGLLVWLLLLAGLLCWRSPSGHR